MGNRFIQHYNFWKIQLTSHNTLGGVDLHWFRFFFHTGTTRNCGKCANSNKIPEKTNDDLKIQRPPTTNQMS